MDIKKSAVESNRLLVESYCNNSLSKGIWRQWFRKNENNDFKVEDKEHKGLKTMI